jgi:hypothetical protein
MIKIIQSNNISDPSEINLLYEFASKVKIFLMPECRCSAEAVDYQ